MFDLVEAYWPYVLGAAGSIAGVVAFLSQVLQIRKLKYEIDRMQQQTASEKQTVRVATLEETERYGVSRPRSLVRKHQQFMVMGLLLAMTGPIVYLLYEPQGPTLSAPRLRFQRNSQ